MMGFQHGDEDRGMHDGLSIVQEQRFCRSRCLPIDETHGRSTHAELAVL